MSHKKNQLQQQVNDLQLHLKLSNAAQEKAQAKAKQVEAACV